MRRLDAESAPLHKRMQRAGLELTVHFRRRSFGVDPRNQRNLIFILPMRKYELLIMWRRLESLLHREFREFGRPGRSYDKAGMPAEQAAAEVFCLLLRNFTPPIPVGEAMQS